MKTLSVLLIMTGLVGCGMKHNVEIQPVQGSAQVGFGPSFSEAAALCDSRYGAKTEEAEKCFLDYRNYTKLRLEFNLEELQTYCTVKYADQDQLQQCIDDLSNFGGVK